MIKMFFLVEFRSVFDLNVLVIVINYLVLDFLDLGENLKVIHSTTVFFLSYVDVALQGSVCCPGLQC